MRQSDITREAVCDVISLWQTSMNMEDAGNINELDSRPTWHLFEAEQHLIIAACVHLGMEPPISVTFSCLNAVEEPGECEAQPFWPMKKHALLDPDRFIVGTVARLYEYKWPGLKLVTHRDEHVRYVIWRMALLRQSADKEAPCISNR